MSGVSSGVYLDHKRMLVDKYGDEFLEKYITYLVGKNGFEGNITDVKNVNKLNPDWFRIDSPELKKYLMDLL